MARAGVVKYVVLFVRMFEGTHMAFSGLDYYFPFIPPAHPTGGVGGMYIDIITQMGLYDTVKVFEAIAGLALMFNLFVPTFLIMAFVIDLNVFYFSVFVMHRYHSTMTAWRDVLFDVILFAAYARYYLPLTTFRAVPDGIWAILGNGGLHGVNQLRRVKTDYSDKVAQ